MGGLAVRRTPNMSARCKTTAQLSCDRIAWCEGGNEHLAWVNFALHHCVLNGHIGELSDQSSAIYDK
ncbi:MAG: hypothetical protein D6709_08815 [Chloroflexi bacterium]|uniref:Uncharacterized protein n=1 Tax=Candidatus Thermofonsia Clade 3 bacterium TaxID=2364212 RepID=A0A2M8QBB0_9CHLR|nr:MAG: hypothetical protein CUN48_10540 [Candidatus Thermofonsia Clade 3 bacterium]RMG63312.1 MAG: hypothetical protein D6709_08815 [Chloroflexota bacterium]